MQKCKKKTADDVFVRSNEKFESVTFVSSQSSDVSQSSAAEDFDPYDVPVAHTSVAL